MTSSPVDAPVAVVTGAAAGIGARTTEVLAAEGYALALLDLQPVGGYPDALAATGDVSSESDVVSFAGTVLERYGRVDVLVNNAGIACISPAEDTSPSVWRRVLEVNLTGPFLLSQAFGRSMLAAGRGSIVNIASVAGLRGVADRSAYNASKHGLVGLTRTLAAEWGGRGVRVNAVCPGWVKTPMDDASQGEGAYGDVDITQHIPMGRFASPDDVAQAVAFLADPRRSGFVNGTTLSVDGGWDADGSWQALRQSTRYRD
ncbi:MAG TPA: SDR family oxidoreductase [Rugosimonospora sp.]|nr:SDR family oxidoreductase [Rugosimonospora sp.]